MRADWNQWDARRMESGEMRFTAEQRSRLSDASRTLAPSSLLDHLDRVDGGVVLNADE